MSFLGGFACGIGFALLLLLFCMWARQRVYAGEYRAPNPRVSRSQ